jgi:hypothetical protein
MASIVHQFRRDVREVQFTAEGLIALCAEHGITECALKDLTDVARLTLMLIPFSQLAVVAARGAASKRAIAMAVLSYALLVWWEYVALSANEFGFLAMLTAYLSAYWLAVDQPDAARLPIRAVPAEIWRRLTPAT